MTSNCMQLRKQVRMDIIRLIIFRRKINALDTVAAGTGMK
jgi:hypothetical protein